MVLRTMAAESTSTVVWLTQRFSDSPVLARRLTNHSMEMVKPPGCKASLNGRGSETEFERELIIARTRHQRSCVAAIIADFCNNIGTTRTSGDVRLESAKRCNADIDQTGGRRMIRG